MAHIWLSLSALAASSTNNVSIIVKGGGAGTQTVMSFIMQAITLLWWLFSSSIGYVLGKLAGFLNIFTPENMEELWRLVSNMAGFAVGIVKAGGAGILTVMNFIMHALTVIWWFCSSLVGYLLGMLAEILTLENMEQLWKLVSNMAWFVDGIVKGGGAVTLTVMNFMMQALIVLWWLFSRSVEYLLGKLAEILWKLFSNMAGFAVGTVNDQKMLGAVNTETAVALVQQTRTGLWWSLSGSVEYLIGKLADCPKMFTLKNTEALWNSFASMAAYAIGIVNHQRLLAGLNTETALSLVAHSSTNLRLLLSSSVEYVLTKLAEVQKLFTLENIEELWKYLSSISAYATGIVNENMLYDAKGCALQTLNAPWDSVSYYAAQMLKLSAEKIDRWITAAMPWLILTFIIVLLILVCCCRR